MFAQGWNGSIEVTDTQIKLTRKIYWMTIEKIIRLDRLQSVQFVKAGLLIRGHIRFEFPGATQTPLALRGAALDENALMFTRKQEPAILQVKELIEQRIGVQA